MSLHESRGLLLVGIHLHFTCSLVLHFTSRLSYNLAAETGAHQLVGCSKPALPLSGKNCLARTLTSACQITQSVPAFDGEVTLLTKLSLPCYSFCT